MSGAIAMLSLMGGLSIGAAISANDASRRWTFATVAMVVAVCMTVLAVAA